ncbi:MAG TPA: aminotransferase class IV [Opitutaceae bacterium]
MSAADSRASSASPFVQANTDGRLHSADEPSLSPLNRGFLYGDAIYEVWRTYGGVVFAWEEHWTRLERSAAALDLRLPWSPADILGQIRRATAAYRERTADTGELYIRLQITRGEGRIGLDPALADRPMYVLLVQGCPVLTSAQAHHGLRLTVARTIRRNPAAALDPAWKTGNYLNNLQALREARSRGADEVLMLNLAGEFTEAAVCNVAWIRGQGAAAELVTPPLSAGILPGITRQTVLGAVAASARLTVREEPIRPEALTGFSECMLLSTTKDIVPVAQIDEAAYPVRPDSATARLKQAFADFAGRYAAGHAAQRV